MLLDACKRGRRYVVKNIAPTNASLFSDIGLFAGRRFTVVDTFPLRGPVMIDLGGCLIAIARSAAVEVCVDPDEQATPKPRPHASTPGDASLQIQSAKRYT